MGWQELGHASARRRNMATSSLMNTLVRSSVAGAGCEEGKLGEHKLLCDMCGVAELSKSSPLVSNNRTPITHDDTQEIADAAWQRL